jgi:exonuclease SbcC
MRLHQLSMTAIGPFSGHVEIDFSRLGESGLFLLEGPTGSGKSTIIDAISFALYGKVAQASGAVERIKSHHAAPGTEPVIELIFETQSGLYRIRRTPSYERAKARGSGTTPANMTVKIFRLTSADEVMGGELVSSRVGEAEDEITRAVGLTHAQFVQTVVLPQGEFSNFLRADTNTKRALLQRLFGTEILARTQERLAEGRKIAIQRRDAASKAIGGAIQAFVAAADVNPEAAAELGQLAETAEPDQLFALTERVLTELRSTATAASRRNKAATARRLTAQRACQQAADLESRRQRRETLRLRERQLSTARDEHDLARAELSAAERALTVIASAETLTTAIGRLSAANEHDLQARSKLPTGLATADEAELRLVAADRHTAIGELADEIRRERELVAVRETCDELKKHDVRLAATAATLKSDLESLPKRIVALTAEHDEAAGAAAQSAALLAECERAEQRLRAAERAVIAERQAREEEQITTAALATLQEYQHRVGVLRHTRVSSIAGELGLSLQVGDPCQVCGSVEHPRPATPGKSHVTEAQVVAAESELSRLSSAAEQCRQQLEQQRSELLVLQYEADSMTPDHARARLDDVASRLEVARAAMVHQQQLAAQLEDLQRQLSELAGELHQVELKRAGLGERLAILQERVVSDDAALAAVRGPHPTVADLVQQLSDEVAFIAAAATAAAALSAATTAEFDASAAFAAALDAAEFLDAAGWHAARRTSAQIATLRAQITAIDADWAGVRAGLAERALNDPELDGEPADLAALTDTLGQAEAAADAAAADYGSARERAQIATDAADLLSQAVDGGRQILRDTVAAIRLGNLVSGNGDNQLKMELTTYVLVRRFGEIVGAANAQLRRVSGGRYELQHTDAKNGNARSGLGLLVLDLHTGRTRDPATLSGGETFYVSLSLALGLADVVRAESGGIDLGTLFIDEGFGSLDPEVLDEVMTVLDSLRAGGRAVGVVSHVAEMKARIPDRVAVRARADGSSTLQVTA